MPRRTITGQLAAIALVVLMIVGCSSADGPASTSPTPELPDSGLVETAETAEPTESEPPHLLDSKTVVFPKGLNNTGDPDTLTEYSPTDDEVAVVLAAVTAAPELAWATDHARFVTGQIDDGIVSIGVSFACDVELTSPEQALEQIRRVSTGTGGGDCYGVAVFDTDGTLLRWRTRGGG